MQQLVYVKKNTIEWRETESPSFTSSNQALVKPLAVSRCDLDLPIIRGQTLFRAPFPIGHEFVGEIVDVTDDLKDNFKKGDRVAVPFQISCGICPHCKTLHSQACETVPFGSNYGIGKSAKDFGGALSDLVLVPYAKEMILPLSPNIDLASIASLSDNMVEAWKLVGQHLDLKPNSSVMVIGGFAASIGLYSVLLAKSMGVKKLLYIDTDRTRLSLVQSFGIDVMEIDQFPRAHAERFDIIADAHGTKEAWLFGLRSASVDGIFGTASIFWTNDLPIPYLDLYNFGIQIHIGRVRSREWMPKILDLVESGTYKPGPVVTKVVSWKDADRAYLEEETKLVVLRN
ncbi:zinc-dependent alcohol dehydrogenase [Leptospira ryugenii]|nr:alcohol dehydrogenase catalytic domain-containing protein [Leptospira ryugenii]